VAARTYVAQPGDSLGAIARKAYGSGCKANRDAIIAANPQIADNGDLIVAGRTYLIPAIANAGAVPAPSVHNNSDRAPAETSVTYTVKSHDTLWSIATTEVGSASAVAQIRELNKDVLNGSDRVRPNMKLKLPAKAAVTVTRND
jgi:nucleoid-associated protein YgaU